MEAEEKKRLIRYFPSAGVGQRLSRKQGFSRHSSYSRRQTLKEQMPPTSSFLLAFIAGQTWYGMEYPFSQLDQLSWLWPLPRSCPPPAHRQEGSVGETALLQCQHCSATAKTLGCEQHLSRYQHSTAQGGLQCGKGAPAHPDPRQPLAADNLLLFTDFYKLQAKIAERPWTLGPFQETEKIV